MVTKICNEIKIDRDYAKESILFNVNGAMDSTEQIIYICICPLFIYSLTLERHRMGDPGDDIKDIKSYQTQYMYMYIVRFRMCIGRCIDVIFFGYKIVLTDLC